MWSRTTRRVSLSRRSIRAIQFSAGIVTSGALGYTLYTHIHRPQLEKDKSHPLPSQTSSSSVLQDVRYFLLATQRCARIVPAIVTCFPDYYYTLHWRNYDSDADYMEALSECHIRCAQRTKKVVEKNAGIFIKLGQHLSALTYLLPPEWTETFIPLQDQCPVSSLESIAKMVLKDTGCELQDLFDDFKPEPLGAASLAQVHHAKLKGTDQHVAVKVQHPSLEEFVPVDVATTRFIFSAISKIFPEYPLTWLAEELDNSIYVELDFTNEAKNATSTTKIFAPLYNETALRIPKVIWSKPRILVMEYLNGARLDDIPYMIKHHIDRDQVSICLSRIFDTMIFTPGVPLHCDPHGGNLAIRSLDNNNKRPWWTRWLPFRQLHDFEIILYDHGLYRNIPENIRVAYAKLWLAFLQSDVPKMKKYAKEFAGIDSETKFDIFTSAITGRSPKIVKSDFLSASPRSHEEELSMASSLAHSGLMTELMQLLSEMPRIILLILKTNDLTRVLDANLECHVGPMRTFLIMASYCARTVYNSQVNELSSHYPWYSPKRFVKQLGAFVIYFDWLAKLYVYDCTIWISDKLRVFVF